MKRIVLFTALTLTAATTAQADMQLSFNSWGNIPSCTTGSPNTVGNPAFTLKGIPKVQLKSRSASKTSMSPATTTVVAKSK